MKKSHVSSFHDGNISMVLLLHSFIIVLLNNNWLFFIYKYFLSIMGSGKQWRSSQVGNGIMVCPGVRTSNMDITVTVYGTKKSIINECFCIYTTKGETETSIRMPWGDYEKIILFSGFFFELKQIIFLKFFFLCVRRICQRKICKCQIFITFV